MVKVIQRAVVPLLFIAGGIALAIYGVMFHVTPVREERVTEEKIEVPDPSAMKGPRRPGQGPMNGPPKMIKKTVKKTTIATLDLLEPAVIRDATVGGLMRVKVSKNDAASQDAPTASQWALQRTYSGEPPSLCPT